jgi:long-chain acyl-CoA synthetase
LALLASDGAPKSIAEGSDSGRSVVGRPVDGNEEVVAFVQLLPGGAATTDDLRRHAAEHLTAYKRPSTIVPLEALPSSSTGKILKHRLAETARQLS